jgi:hypothetical protein
MSKGEVTRIRILDTAMQLASRNGLDVLIKNRKPRSR